MQQFKFESNEADLSCLQHYSSEELSLLNSRRRHNGDFSERESEVERQNEEQIKEFRRQIQERFKLSICNKIYTFPRIIKSIYDIVSSEEEEETATTEQIKPNDRYQRNQFKKTDKNVFEHSKKKASEHNKAQFNQNPSKIFDSTKIGKDKLKTNESTGKRKEEEGKPMKTEKTASGKKERKKTQRLKTEMQSSGSFLQTLRSKVGKKN